MEYLDFNLLLERSGDELFARVSSSPAGQAEAAFQLPFDEKDLEIFRLRVGQPRKGVRRANSEETKLAQEYGARLFEAVFAGEVRSCFRSSHDLAHRERKGLRVRLRIKDPRLASLPWEYLYNPSQNNFLSLAVDTPVVRYLDLPRPVLPLEFALPLKILCVIASPKDQPPLEVETEWQRLNEALAEVLQAGFASLERLETPTLGALPSFLRSRGPFHVLHFVGHGAFDEATQDGQLMFENEHGYSQPVSGQRLGTILHNHPSLRLAVLNACEGARTSEEDPFAGVAHSLVQQALPAVVAMQFEITDQSALIFAREFYAALAAGSPVDTALTEARVAIFAAGNDIEWGTPVLFTLLPDGRLFNPGSQRFPGKPLAEAVNAEDIGQAQQAYESGLAAYFTRDWERARQLFQKALALRPGFTQAAQKLKEVEKERDLDERYRQAQEKIRLEDWQAALEILENLDRRAPAYRDTPVLLSSARRKIELADLYAAARRLYKEGNPQAVLDLFKRIHSLDKAYPDPEGLYDAARKNLVEKERHARLETIYRSALQAMEGKRWPDAHRLLKQVLTEDKTYGNTAALLERVESELQAQNKSVQKRDRALPAPSTPRLPRYLLALLGGGALLAVCLVGGIFFSLSISRWNAAAAPTRTAIARLNAEKTTTAEAEAAQAALQARMKATQTAAGAWDVLAVEPFDDNRFKWNLGNDLTDFGSGTLEIISGVYRLEYHAKQAVHYRVFPDVANVNDFYLEVEGLVTEATTPSGASPQYGACFRQVDNNYYSFLMDNQEWTFLLHDGDEWITIQDRTPNPAIHPDQKNKFAVLAQGSQFVFYINDLYVGEAIDSRLARGPVGLSIQLGEGDSATYQFDNFTLRSR